MSDQELSTAVGEYQQSESDEQRIASLKKISSQVKHKALASSTSVLIIELITDALKYKGEVRDAALSLLSYLVRRISSSGHFALPEICVALSTIPNWPDVLTALRKRGVPSSVRIELELSLEQPPDEDMVYSPPPVHITRAPVSKPAAKPAASSKVTKGRSLASSAPTPDLEPVYFANSHELDRLCNDMLPDFEGKESEHNWPRRDKHITKLRQITLGNAVSDFPDAYIANWKILLDGIIKSATSLRTTFSTNACQFIQESAAAVGHSLDPFAGRLLEFSVKLCGDTKLLAAQNGNKNFLALVSNVSWSRQILSYISEACQDKNVRPREFSYGWVQAALRVHSQRKSVLEQFHGVDVFDKCFRRGMADPNPKVRETAKKAFWDYHNVWPKHANALLTSLDEKTQKSIHAVNPEGASAAAALSAASEAPGVKAKAITGRPSIKDMMAQKRREAMKIKATERPQSALATFPPTEPKTVKKPGPAAHKSAFDAPSTGGGISGAPVRPGRKMISRTLSRPEMSASVESTDRPKTPFRSGVPRRPESRAEEKRNDGPRRPATHATRPAATAAISAPTRTIPQPSSLPASPEKALQSPISRRPKSITEDSPIAAQSRVLPVRTRFGSPASPERHFKALENSPRSLIPSRLSTPAHVYEDPRISPSVSPQEDRGNTPMLATRDMNRMDLNSPLSSRSTVAKAPNGDASLRGGEPISPIKMPLKELNTNEIVTPGGSGGNDARNAKLIDSGITHMKTGRLDPHGYRRLHSALLEQIDVLPQEKFDELLTTILSAAPAGQENSTNASAGMTGERIILQRLHLLSALKNSPFIQQYMAQVLRAFIHIIRHESVHNGHTYWIAEGQLREFAEMYTAKPNEVARGVLAEPQSVLHAMVLKCISFLVENKHFDKEDSELVATAATLAGQAVAADKDVDARIQGHRLAKALGMDTIKKVLGEERSGVAFMLYQSMKEDD